MPGPTSDSYDPEFGTGANAHDVRSGIRDVVDEIGKLLGPELKDIVQVAQMESSQCFAMFSERELRLIRFGLLRALEDI